MENKNLFEIDFLSLRQIPEITAFEFLGTKKPVKDNCKEIVEIPPFFFDNNESGNAILKLYKNNMLFNVCIFEIFKTYNHCYCFLDEKGYTFQLLFNKVNIDNALIPLYKDKNIILNKFDDNRTKYRKRLLIANFSSFSIQINGFYLPIPPILKDIGSYQISNYNIEKNLSIVKAVKIPRKVNIFIEYYNRYNIIAKEFQVDLNTVISKGRDDFYKNFNSLINKYAILGKIRLFLNQDKSKLKNELNDNEYIKFCYLLSLYQVLESTEIHYDNIKEICAFLEEKSKEIFNDNNLLIYQKILLTHQFLRFSMKHQTKESLDKFNYYKMSLKKEGSILDYIQNFFSEFVELLTEDSPIFNYLLEIDSGTGIYNGDFYYCFNMKNLEEIKEHLRNIQIDILTTINVETDECGYTNPETGMITINLHDIGDIRTEMISFYEKLEIGQILIGKDIAAKIVYYLLHEINGHKKFGYRMNDFSLSLCNFIKDEIESKKDNYNSESLSENTYKIIQDNSIAEDGYYYELPYGKIGDYYTVEIIDKLKGFGELLDEVNLWVNDLQTFKEYIKIKYIKQELNLNSVSDKKSIKEKIEDYNKEIQLTGCNTEKFFKISKPKKKLNNKVKEENSINEDIFDEMSYSQLVNLENSGILTGSQLGRCRRKRRILEYQIRYSFKNCKFD